MKCFRDKTRWLMLAVVLMALPSMAEVRDTVDFDFLARTYENITVGNETFIRYSFPDCDHIDQVGAPMLPVKYIRLSVPYNATNITVKPLCSWTPAFENKREYPAPVPLTTNDTIPDQPELVIDSAIYMTDAYWPPAAAELVGEGFYMGENHIITVAVYPMLYNPVQNKMHNYTQVCVKVNYDLGGTPANMLVRRGGDLRQQEQQAAKAIVDNPHQVEGFAVPAAQAHHMPAHGLIPDSLLTDTASYYYGGELYTWGDRARYLIVTTRELAPSFKRLAALKRQKGYSVQIKCIEDILTDPRVQHGDVFVRANGDTISFINDDAGKLRQYLKLAHAYDNTQFVLLGGKDIPFRYGYNQYIGQTFRSIPTDWYYCDLTTNWNIDNDDLYGEYNRFTLNNPFDREPELFVGRLMADESSHIVNYTDKLLRYELNPGNGNASYVSRSLFTEGSLFNNIDSIASSFENIFDDVVIMKQTSNSQLYPKASEIMSAFNTNPFGFLTIYGHGSPKSVLVSNAMGNTSYLYSLSDYLIGDNNSSIDQMNNKYMPGIYYSLSCVNMPFDVLENYNVFNLGQSYTLGMNYGGVAFLGNTRNTFHNISDSNTGCGLLEKKFAAQISNGNTQCGIAEALSKSNDSDVYMDMIHNLLGEPEFDIWTDTPQSFSGISTSRSNNSICVSGLPSNTEVKVALCSNNSTTLFRTTSSGIITFENINPNSPIMIYHHNYFPYIVPLLLQNERITHSQYVIANDVCAGRNVDTNRANGDLTIAAGVEYELDAKGQVLLAPGFKVEKGALFSVLKSDY